MRGSTMHNRRISFNSKPIHCRGEWAGSVRKARNPPGHRDGGNDESDSAPVVERETFDVTFRHS